MPYSMGAFALPVSIAARTDLLGTKWPFTLNAASGQISGHLSFPSGTDTFLEMPPDGDRFLAEKLRRHFPFLFWGTSHQGPRVAPNAIPARIEAVLVRFDGKLNGPAVSGPLLAWLARVFDWVQALTEQDLYQWEADPFEHRARHEPQLWCFEDSGEPQAEGEHALWLPSSRPSLMQASKLVGVEHWRRAVEEIQGGNDAPLAHQLLNTARSFLARRRFRRAVIDAAGAAEVTLADEMRRLGKDVTKATLGTLVEECSRNGVDVPSGAKDDLVTPRNDATHRATEPSPAITEAACACARAIVRKHSPL